MPHKRNPIVAERICGIARLVRGYALVGLENVALWHERDISHSSAERRILPDAFLAVDYMLDRFSWLMDGLVIRPERMRSNLEATGGLFFSQRLLLALVESGLDRDTAYRAVSDTPCVPGTRVSTSAISCAAMPRSRRVCLDEVFDLTAFTRRRRSSSVGFTLRGARRFMSEAVHVASGKVREIYALDEGRLMLVASDRISTFDVILPTPIPDKGRVLTGLSAFWFARTTEIVTNHLLELRPDGRTMVCRRLEMLPIECVVRGYLTGSGWRDYQATGTVCGHVLPEGLRDSDRLARRSSLPRPRQTKGTTRTSTRARRRSCAGRTSIARRRRLRLRCTSSRLRMPRRAGSSSPTRSSSSVSRLMALSSSETRR